MHLSRTGRDADPEPVEEIQAAGVPRSPSPAPARRRAGTARRALALALAAVLVEIAGVPSRASAAPAPDTKIDTVLLGVADGKVVDFWVTFSAKATLGPAAKATGWQERGQAVVDGLQGTAKTSQAPVAKLLAAKGVKFDSYWIANTAKVSGPKSLMRQLAARPEVERVVADRTFALPEPTPAADLGPTALDWNIDAIHAPAVWADLSVRGEGIVVANLDTGVQFDHPALVNQYRGNLGGSFNHNYNWYDPSQVCGNPSLAPCDNNQHGTHTMGTMVGDDGTGQNRVGVAPGAKWIAVKGCEYNSCSTSALLAGGQWLLAPTDLTGQNPRPDLRPNVVNNSWGGAGQNPFFRDIVTAWVASGIFPVFANGNSGPSCGTAGSPADYPESYAVGADNSAGGIASFSSRGSPPGLVKPDITAPGEGVRSSVPGNGYSVFSGTSMAAPHVAGAVALMWSAAPSLVSDVARTKEILDQTAVDVADLTCGGTNGDNGVWGQGKLDVLAAVLASPRGPVGRLSGVIADVVSGAPVGGAQVRSVGADMFPRVAVTGVAGAFSQLLPVGPVHIEVTAFGYLQGTADVVIVVDQTAVANLSLTPRPRHAVSGTVRDDRGVPVEGASVSVTGVPVQPARTDAAGLFGLGPVPDGTYQVVASAGPCLSVATRDVVLAVDTTLAFVLAARRDDFGYGCRSQAPAYVEAGNVLPLSGDDTAVLVTLPFPFSFYGSSYDTATVSTNGLVGLSQGSTSYGNVAIPTTTVPNGTIYAFWDDLYVDSTSTVRTALVGVEPDLRFVIEWRNIRFLSSGARIDFEAVLDQRGGVVLEYRGLSDDPLVRGSSATIGIENATGTTGIGYSYNQPVLTGTAMALRFETAASVGNIAPDAVADTATTVAGRSVTVALLANDRDPDGGALDVTGAADPAHGTATLWADDRLTYTPDLGFSGTEVFTYDLADGRGGTDGATVTVVVAPLATDDAVTTAEDTAVTLPVLANDANPASGVLRVDSVSLPSHGIAVIVVGGLVQYTPMRDFNGLDSFSYLVGDGLGGFDQGAVTVAVLPVNDPPTVNGDSVEVPAGGPTTIAVLANDIDVDGDALQVVAVSDPPHATAAVNAGQSVIYQPDVGYSGADAFTYDVSDGHGGTGRATVNVVVRAPTTTTSSTTTTTVAPPTTTTTSVPPTSTSTSTSTTTTSTTTTTTRPPNAATPRAPYSVWTQASPALLDGTGTWLATLNDPVPAAGQQSPDYLYGLSFGFASGAARGVVGLSTGPAGKTAVLSVTGPVAGPQTVSIPFPWTAGRFYYLFVHQYGAGTWGALVYDLTANRWTVIGALSVPPEWGQLSPTTITALFSLGPPAATCGAYPRADLFMHAPTAYVGSATSDATLFQGGTTDGTCAGGHVVSGGGWIRYVAGAP